MSTGDSRELSIFYITDLGRGLANKLQGMNPDAETLKFVSKAVSARWMKGKTLVFIMASGIAVRTIAPLLKDKKTDPAVIVMDEKGENVISLLSGHLGGANEKARDIAKFLGANPVVTTASDVSGLPSLDMWAVENGLAIEQWDRLPKISTRFLNKGKLRVYSDVEIPFPPEFERACSPREADVLITNIDKIPGISGKALFLRPRNIILGAGCNSGTKEEEIEAVVKNKLAERNFSFLSVCAVATIDVKTKEKGLVGFADKFGLPLLGFKASELNQVKGVNKSEAVFRAVGAYAVAEPAAMLAASAKKLLFSKQKSGNVTVAASVVEKGVFKLKKKNIKNEGGIYVVGTGPGSPEHITPYALETIRKSDAIVGYGTYIDLIKDLISDKEIISTGMTQEIDRCKRAVEEACKGKTVSVISSGDPGIYAMAGLVLELLKAESESRRDSGRRGELPSVEIVPGISALNACASRLGAPLMHDFAAISLSDRLTDWNLIEKRLEAAASADFVVALYNPKSMGRPGHINRAREIILKHRDASTPVGIVKGAMREDEKITLTDLEHMLDHEIDMQTTVIIGNSKTLLWNGLMITPRGYEKKLKRGNERTSG